MVGFPSFFSFGGEIVGYRVFVYDGKGKWVIRLGFSYFYFSAYDHSFHCLGFLLFFFFLEMDSRLSRFFLLPFISLHFSFLSPS